MNIESYQEKAVFLRSAKLFLMSLSLVLSVQLSAQIIDVSNSSNQSVYLGEQMEILGDCSPDLSIKEVINNTDFQKSDSKVPNFFVSEHAHWAKLKFNNPKGKKEYLLELSQPTLAEVSFYLVKNGFVVKQLDAGLSVSAKEWYKDGVNFIFPFSMDTEEGASVYIRIKSGDQCSLPLKVYERVQYQKALFNQTLFFGIYAGIFLVMMLYNTFVFFSTKDKSYLLYVFYIIVVGLTQANYLGYLFPLIYPEVPDLAVFMTYFLGAFSGVFAVVFMRYFLRTNKRIPRLDQGFKVFVAIYFIATFLAVFEYHNLSYQIIQFNAMLLAVFMIMVASKLAFQGYRDAKFFLLSWSSFLLGVCFFVAKDYGILTYNWFTYNGMVLGSALEVILLSFALADRINQLKKEKDEEQSARLVVIEENERIVREQNIVLEAKVEERTKELEQSNSDLNKTLSNLKEAQSQLVDAEKMASLGQMTAGIAHELNNPINFVSSNVAPLRRDLDDVFEVLTAYEKLELDDPNVKQSFEEIEELKEELELDFIKNEIQSLIQGIEEGASRTATIVKGLRVFSRLDEDALKKASINECLESTLIVVKSAIDGAVIVDKRLDENLPSINCYPGKLNQVFMNIITNAAQATKKNGKEEKRVNINTSFDDQYVYISISDNGIGMDEKTKSKIFDPFFTTKEVGEGTGLGLSIVLGIMNDHNGKIEVESTVGEGTEFLLTLSRSL